MSYAKTAAGLANAFRALPGVRVEVVPTSASASNVRAYDAATGALIRAYGVSQYGASSSEMGYAPLAQMNAVDRAFKRWRR